MKEKIFITFIALILGLFITTIIFYIYESTKTKPEIKEKIVSSITPKTQTPTPTPTAKIEKLFLAINEPQNETVVTKATIEIKGKTNPENSVIVSSNLEDATVNPNSSGDFSVAIALENGINMITIRALSPKGEETSETRIVTLSQEEF